MDLLSIVAVLNLPRFQRVRFVRICARNEPNHRKHDIRIVSHSPCVGQRLPIIRAPEVQHRNIIRVVVRLCKPSVDQYADRARRVREYPFVDISYGGINIFHFAVYRLLSVEGYDYQGRALVLGNIAYVLVHGGEWAPGREGLRPNTLGSELVVVEGSDDLVGLGLDVAGVPGAGSAGVVGHEHGRGTTHELDELKGEDGDGGPRGGVGGPEEVDDGGDVARVVDARKDAELVIRFGFLYRAALVGYHVLYGLVVEGCWGDDHCHYEDCHHHQ